MIFNRNLHGSEELRQATASFYANADFSKIESLVEQSQQQLATLLGEDVVASIEQQYLAGDDSPVIRAAQRAVGYMATLRYFRLNDISHETDGRKVKMDADNERRPFEWQLERDDKMHLLEYYNALDQLISLLRSSDTFQQSQLYKRIAPLAIQSAADMEWLTGVEVSPHLFLRVLPFINEAQRYVERRLGYTIDSADDDTLKNLAQAAVANRALALFVQKTEMNALPAGAFREAVSAGGHSAQSTTAMLHDYYQHVLDIAEGYVRDMQCRRDTINNEHASHLVIPDNNPSNPFFIL